jgi:predicted transcriptional regulator of viral defense system
VEDKFEKYIKIFKDNNGILRAAKAIDLGVPKHVIYEMQRNGDLIQEARGLYRLALSEPLGNPDLVQVGLQIPRGVIFLISSLYFHKLTTQIPDRVYVALPQHIKKPRIDYPPLKFYYLSERPFEAGIEEHCIDGVTVKIYSREKTVTDCFKYRNQIGKELAVEALKDYMHRSSPNVNALIEYAKINRVEKIIRPYMEALF